MEVVFIVWTNQNISYHDQTLILVHKLEDFDDAITS